MRRLSSCVAVRMVMMALLVVVPSLGVILYEQASDLRHDRELAADNARRLAHLAADEQTGIFRGVQRLLTTLAHFPELRQDSPNACGALLPEILREHSSYINIFVVRGDGSPFCVARPVPASSHWISSSDSAWFVRATQTRAFAFGDRQISRTTGRPSIVLALPLLGNDGAVDRVVAATVDLDQLNALFDKVTLPAGAELTLADRHGTILARAQGRGTRESTLADRGSRFSTTAPVDTGADGGLLVTFDIDSSVLYAGTRPLLIRHAVLFTIVMLWSIAAALIGRRAVVRPVESAHAEVEDQLQFALEASRVGVWEANIRTDVAYWSRITEEMHGLAPGTFGRSLKSFLALIHPDDAARVNEAIDHAIRNHHDSHIEYRVIWPDGTEHRISSTCRFFYDDAGVPLRGAGIAIDVTSQRSLEEQLRQSQKMDAIGQLAGGIAHDFNNMLMAILGNAGFLLEELPQGDRRRDDVEEIISAGGRARALIQQLLTFGRKQINAPKVITLGEVVTGVTPMLRRLIGASVDLQTTIGERRRVKADARQIEQVLVNLAVNARDAMTAGGRLTIETRDVDIVAPAMQNGTEPEPGSYVVVEVTDAGHGMDALTQKRIFEPFFTTKPSGRGTGLGLATVYGIVKQNGGHIVVDSAPDRGTTFRVYLPKTDEPPAPETITREGELPRGTERVMVVEDEPAVRTLVTRALTRLGYHVTAFESPLPAIDFAMANPGIDLILTDVMLPEMTGVAMVAELKSRLLKRPVVYMSGYARDAVLDADTLTADVVFVQKPLTNEKLAVAVRRALTPLAVA